MSCQAEDHVDPCESFGASSTKKLDSIAKTPERNQLLRSLAQGLVDHDSIAQIVASPRPEDTRTRRILSQINFQGRPPLSQKSNESQKKQTSAQVSSLHEAIHISAKDSAADAVRESETISPLGAKEATKNTRSARPQDLSRLKFRSRSGKTILRLYGNKPLTIRKVSVASGRRLRLVVEGQSASAKVLRSRARGRGVQVSHVKMGDHSILIVLELDDGWYAQDPRSRRNGAEIVFTRG